MSDDFTFVVDEPTAEEDVEVLTNENNCSIPYAAVRKAMDGENYTMSLVGDDARVVVNAVNIGIDSRLQACCGENDDYGDGKRTIIADEDGARWKAGDELVLAHTLECSVSPESLPVLLRRLFEDMKGDDDADDGMSLAASILLTLGFDEQGVFVGREKLGLD